MLILKIIFKIKIKEVENPRHCIAGQFLHYNLNGTCKQVSFIQEDG
jgi:hypothetical protein